MSVRKRYRVLLLAVIVAAFVVPLGFALSLESESRTISSRARPASAARTLAAQPAAIAGPALLRAGTPGWPSGLAPIAEGARLLLVGTVFLGLAAVIRRTV